TDLVRPAVSHCRGQCRAHAIRHDGESLVSDRSARIEYDANLRNSYSVARAATTRAFGCADGFLDRDRHSRIVESAPHPIIESLCADEGRGRLPTPGEDMGEHTRVTMLHAFKLDHPVGLDFGNWLADTPGAAAE